MVGYVKIGMRRGLKLGLRLRVRAKVRFRVRKIGVRMRSKFRRRVKVMVTGMFRIDLKLGFIIPKRTQQVRLAISQNNQPLNKKPTRENE
jgi:hypothetical protein